jgi:hypothetical protein
LLHQLQGTIEDRVRSAASLQPRGSGLVAHLIERRIIRLVTHSIVGVRDHRSAAEWRLLFEVFVIIQFLKEFG